MINGKAVAVIIMVLTAFAVGRYSVVKEPQRQETKDTSKSRDTETHTVITHTEAPSGEKKTVTVIDKTSKTKVDEEIAKIVTPPPKPSKLNISALGGMKYEDRQLIWGVSVSKQLIGPITGGAWVLNNGTLGVSVGLDF